MNWTEFMMILIGIYFAYYGLNLVFDLLNTREPPRSDNGDDGVLHFSEDEPELIIPAREKNADLGLDKTDNSSPFDSSVSSAGLISSGAVSLKQLFELAKDDLIEYTKAISY